GRARLCDCRSAVSRGDLDAGGTATIEDAVRAGPAEPGARGARPRSGAPAGGAPEGPAGGIDRRTSEQIAARVHGTDQYEKTPMRTHTRNTPMLASLNSALIVVVLLASAGCGTV